MERRAHAGITRKLLHHVPASLAAHHVPLAQSKL
jgi:hypothetical protein